MAMTIRKTYGCFAKLPLALLLSSSFLTSFASYAATVPAGVELAAKQEIVRNNGSEPASLDPHKVESDVEFNILSDLFTGLITIDNNGNAQPSLSSSWESKDNKTWVFHLRQGIVWSDGTPITAQDVVFSWRRLIDPKTASPYESYLGSMHVLNANDIIGGKKTADQLGIRALDNKRWKSPWISRCLTSWACLRTLPFLRSVRRMSKSSVISGHSRRTWSAAARSSSIPGR